MTFVGKELAHGGGDDFGKRLDAGLGTGGGEPLQDIGKLEDKDVNVVVLH